MRQVKCRPSAMLVLMGLVAGPGLSAAQTSSTPTASGPGTEEFEAERGYSAKSVRVTPPPKADDTGPLRFDLHGYYRARYNWIGNVPLASGSATTMPSERASYGYMRLRIDPEVTYGPNPDLPIARLRFTIDGFDNVVFGDNARVFSTPLFAVDQSATTVDGFDLRDTFKLERAWIEFLVPAGQIRVGRMESQWALGLLTHAGNGLAEWGDFLRGETFDRVLFATRPITLAKSIKSGDTRSTPLIYAFVYDRLSQDPVVDPTISSPPAATNPNFKPTYTTFPERSTFPLGYLVNLDRRVSEIANALAWVDEDYGNAVDDELFVGAYIVYRWQQSTETRIIIPDISWRLRHTVGSRGLAIVTEGEYTPIFGHSGALPLTFGCPPEPCNRGTANIHGVLGRIGVVKPSRWAFRFESGFASGDTQLLNDQLTTRGFNPNIKVGLLMYQVALKALSYDALSPLGAEQLGANGSVYNSKYFYPQFRITIIPGLEAHVTGLIGWAHELDPLIYGGRTDDSCGFKAGCFYGWELDAALRARMGRDIIWIDLETGVLGPGKAFTESGMNDRYLWTVQLRAAMVY